MTLCLCLSYTASMAGRIPQQFLQDLLARVDIVQVIEPRVPLRKAGREYKACCPFHGEKTPSFTVSPTKQFYHCFGCGVHGTALSFLMEHDRLEFRDAVEELASSVGMEVPYEAGSPQQQVSKDFYEISERVGRHYQAALKSSADAVEYLKQRGVSGEVAAEFGIGFAPPGWDGLSVLNMNDKQLLELGLRIEREGSGGSYDRFRNRIMFPIRDGRGRVIAFGGRAMGDDNPKYMNSPESPIFHKGRELYGLWEARQANRDLAQVFVVEGYMDVVALAQFGITNAVATLGTATTGDHIAKLFRTTHELVFCFDGDRAGRDAAAKALEICIAHMQDGKQVRFMFLPDGEDPDTMVRAEGQEAFLARAKKSRTLSEYLLGQLLAKTDSTLEGRARLIALSRPYYEKMPAGTYRSMVVEMIAREANMDRDRAEKELGGVPDVVSRQSGKFNPRQPQQKPSLMKTALTRLLQYPELASRATDTESIRNLTVRASDVLAELLEKLQDTPNMSMAQLLLPWEGTEVHRFLQGLAFISEDIELEQAQGEFDDAISRLLQRNIEQEIDRLMQKNRQEGQLDDSEKERLKRLLQARTRT